MPVTMDGLSSGIKTDEIVAKLKKIEQNRVDEYDLHINELKYQNEALKELRKMAFELQKSLESLYNFDSPFEKKLVEAAPDGFITGVANKDASYGQHKIEIKNLAQKLNISSREIPPEEKISNSEISINDKVSRFQGGTLTEFRDFLNSNYTKDLEAKVIQKSPTKTILVIESKTEGKKGLLKISDNAGVFKKLEITGQEISEKNPDNQKPDENSKREDFERIPFSLSRLSVVNEGPASISEDQKNMTLGGNSSRRLEIVSENKTGRKIKAITFELEPVNKPDQKENMDNTPVELNQGPVNTINIKGISLNTYNIPREREKETTPVNADDFDFGIMLNGSSQSLKKSDNLINIPIDKIPDHIDFFTRNRQIIFKNLQLVYSIDNKDQIDPENQNKMENGDEDQKRQKAMFPHLLSPAKDAQLNVDGIDLERDKNNMITDIIPGATIDLKQTTTSPVMVNINANMKRSQEMIADFIKKYNDLMDFSRNVSSGVKKNAEGRLETLSEKEKKETPLITSSLVRSLITGLQGKISNAYPAVLEPKIRILPMIGIGTGKPNSAWAKISNLHLMFENNDLFQEMVNKYPTAVKEFFGQDKNGDRSFDDGLAFQIVKFLEGYTTQLNHGVIQSQLGSNETRIKNLEKDKERKQASVIEYEKKLKQKFGRMESVISKQKETGNALKQKFKTED